ncbi:MAG TPA: HlyD family efflux transporter periplasmic adaptor subunit [Phycisphaerales bacterium]|nr:HlyD family efflux transporter periplasmic adaptor subunit [Phycisphaerales bacterium]HMP36195.1 HlyD family efflux transporter periplasmic adaptor subunit [Phycisphaerales bacterium]
MKPLCALAVAAGLIAACSERSPLAPPAPPSTSAGFSVEAPTNRIDISAPVRRTLGLTFVRVERRAVGGVIRLPGRAEPAPDARREYGAPLDGRIELLVDELEPVQPGRPLARLDAPGWRALQREIAEAESGMLAAEAGIAAMPSLRAAHELHERGLRARADVLRRRVEELDALAAAGAARRDEIVAAQSALAEAESALGEVLEKDAQLDVRLTQLETDRVIAATRVALLLEQAAMLHGLDAEALAAPVGSADGSPPLWRALREIELRAVEPGIVERRHIASGAGVAATTTVLTTIRPERLRFRAALPQADLTRVRDGLPAEVVPAFHGSAGVGPSTAVRGTPPVDSAESVATSIALVPAIDVSRRTIDVVAPLQPRPWLRPGASAFIEIMPGSGELESAIPLACVVREGTRSVIFRRDPRNPDVAIRLDADLGPDDGRWVAIRSGVREGDEIVLDGARELARAMSEANAGPQRRGHFHADGTFHAEDH